MNDTDRPFDPTPVHPAGSGDPRPPEDPSGDPSSPVTRFTRVFTAPILLFQELAEHPRTLGAVALGAVLSALSTLLLPLEIFEAGLREQLLATGQELPGDLGLAARIGWVVTIFSSVVVWPLLTLVSAGLFALVFLFLFGYQGSFRVLLSMTAHALLVAAVGSVLVVPLKILAGDASISLTPALFLPGDAEGVLGRFLGLLEFFNLWTYALIGAAAAVMDGTRSIRHGVTVALSVSVGLSFLLALLGGMVGGSGAG